MKTLLLAAAVASWQAPALDAIKTEKEVVEATFPAPNSLWVSVRSNGSNRDGLAEYYCLTLQLEGKPKGKTIVVRVLDAANLDKVLGKHVCE